MKVSEVYKILESQPNRRFKVTKLSDVATMPLETVLYLDSNGSLLNTNNNYSTYLNINSEFELIQEPVDFITAIKAYSEGKTIKSETDTEVNTVNTTYVPNECCCFGYNLIDENEDTITSKEILKGKWYIED